ncbi:hypothetical protein FEM48_Zijuj08G0155100 [Ziziphus jujuba var. spinosa]|uniref:H15 domain-containing protein n=1 Tax=Ziziphus jujuba var. spinosa TaxID=714518 RepID=A0A978UZX7_ZIZJJ|nr:hypothetical protein FEM48_Zijuj08G0155100 [Ziziphus jujuba var. spinosa]
MEISTYQRYEIKKIISKLTDAVLEEFARSNPSKTLIPDYKNHIKQQLQGFFPNFRTPTHPTYSVMIFRAITELEEERGSSEEAISEFIKQKFEDLPWAHASLLRHHLKKLSQSGEIIAVSENSYMLPDENANSVIKTEKGSKEKKKHEQGRGKKRQHVTKHGDQSQEGQMVKKMKQSQKLKVAVREEDKVQGLLKKIDDQNQSQEQQINQNGERRQKELKVGFSSKQRPVGEQQSEVDQNQAQILEHEDEMEEQEVDVKEKIQEEGNEVEVFEGQKVARRHELEKIGGKSLLQKHEVSSQPVNSGEIDADAEECNQAQLPQVQRIVQVLEGQNIATRLELEKIRGKNLSQEWQLEEQKQEVSCEPVKSGEIDVDEECNQAQLPQAERICDQKQAKRQSEAIDSQCQAETQLIKENKENAQQSEEVLNTLSERQIEVFEDQLPAKQQFEVIEQQKEAPGRAVKGYENSEQAEKKQEEVITELNDHGQQMHVTEKLIESKDEESKMINKQTQEQQNEVVKDQSQSPFQQNQPQDEGYEQPIPTQREEIAVGVLQKSKAKWKDKVTEEQRQDPHEQELYRIKEKQNEMAQGQRQVGDIERTVHLQEEQVEVIENHSKLPRQRNEVIAEKNKQLEIINSQIDLSKMQELLLKKHGKEAHATALDPSFTAKILDRGGSSTLIEKYLKLLKERQKIEEELFRIFYLFSATEESNHSSRESVGGIAASPELPFGSLQLRGNRELCSQKQTSEPLPVRSSFTTSVNSVMHALEREPEVRKLERNPQLKPSTVVQAIVTSHDPITSVNELHHVQKHLKHQGYLHPPGSNGDEDATIVISSPEGEQDDPEKQKLQSKGQKRFLTPRCNPEATLSVPGLLDIQNHNLGMKQQPKKDGRGRPRKQKSDAENTTGDKMISQPKKDGRGRPRKQKSDAEATPDKLISQPKKDGRGRPRKRTLDDEATPGDKLISHKKQEQRGRPRKQKLLADTTMGDILIPQNKQDANTTTGDILMLQNKLDSDTPTGDILIPQKKQDADTPNGDILSLQKKKDADTATRDILI